MSEFSLKVFDPRYKLDSPTLVEASAGTGKTFNIQNVYLRLVVERSLKVEQILVVTFTDAATHELRERLRTILTKCRARLEDRLDAGDEDWTRVNEVIDLPVDGYTGEGKKVEQLARLRLALMDFDNAAIFTIHGFCNRVLDRYSFECGHDPDSELLARQDEIIEETCRDWWRRETYGAGNFADCIPFEGPAELNQFVNEALARSDAAFRPEPGTSEDDIFDKLARRLGREAEKFLESRGKGCNLAALEADAAAMAMERKLAAIVAGGEDRLVGMKDVTELLGLLPSARWAQTPRFPACVEQVIAECNAVMEQLGALSGKITWLAGGFIAKTNGVPVSLKALRGAVQGEDNGRAIREWMKDPNTFWKINRGSKTAAAVDMAEGLSQVLAVTSVFPVEGDAKPFCKQIKALAGTEIEKVLDAGLQLGRLAAALVGALGSCSPSILREKAVIIVGLAGQVRARIRERRALTYDGMLENVRNALEDGQGGDRLLEVLRDEFKAALIDEFQDTDPVQYGIFDRIFNMAGIPLLFVGDPKQAIYGFRGGDVFTYYGARKTVLEEHRHQLGTNYRCESNLMRAVNELFIDLNGRKSFLNTHIDYSTSLLANDVPEEKRLIENGRRDERPLKIWHYALKITKNEKSGKKVPGQDSTFARHVYASVADEVVRLTGVTGPLLGGRRVRPQDIAILVLTHAEADHFQQELTMRGVNAVRQNTGNVFDAAEATGMALIMQAMLDPGSARTVRSALCTSIIPCSAVDILRFSPEYAGGAATQGVAANGLPVDLDSWMDLFMEAGNLWRRRSFIEAFRLLAGRLGMRAHIIGMEDGERKLTNVLHLAELVHQAAREQQLGPDGLLRWFAGQLDGNDRDGSEEYEMRLASDEAAVKIMTVFKSKGLEFPIVFAPTLWRRRAEGTGRKRKMLAYHDEENRMILDLDKESEDGNERVRREALEENVRLVYVAATRAVNRTYLVSIDKGDENSYALRSLLALFDGQEVGTAVNIDLVGREWFGAAAAGQETVCNAGQPKAPVSLMHEGERSREPDVDKSHGHTSFSGLAPHESGRRQFEIRDVDQGAEGVGADAARKETDIFSIPGGAKTGDCWHEILEKLDFQAGEDVVKAAVNAGLDRCGICSGPTEELINRKRASVLAMIMNVLKVPLKAGADTFSLKDIPMADRRSELAFHFSLKQQGERQALSAIADILDREWKSVGRNGAFVKNMKGWDARLPLGFMTGFIDLVFHHAGKFYIADWKSNRRGGRARDFDDRGLADEMATNSYYLQYMIYTVALHAYLGRSLVDYDYGKNFGGVFYVFLRGVDGTPGRGIFFDRPSAPLVGRLSEVLARGKEDGK